jgi:hypothetical protein
MHGVCELSVASWCPLPLLLLAGTFLPPLSWPVISACVWLALLHQLPRPHGSDRRQACAGLLSAAVMLVFLLQDGEFDSWGRSRTLHLQRHLAYASVASLRSSWRQAAIVCWGESGSM